jgi:quinol-cytochrome oxidoreductase complex cytochrome b subunit
MRSAVAGRYGDPVAAQRGAKDGLERARALALAVLLVEVGVLALTGIALYFVYRPSDVSAWNDIRALNSGPRIGYIVRAVHLNVARLAVPTVLVAGVLTALVRSARRRWLGPAVGTAMVPVAAAAFATGFRLPWDQLALWAVTVGRNFPGYEPLRDGSVRFVLIGGAEVSPSTILRWLLAHVALGGLLAVLAALAWRRRASGSGAAEQHRVTELEEMVPADVGSGRAW